jgi:hypothetical protein
LSETEKLLLGLMDTDDWGTSLLIPTEGLLEVFETGGNLNPEQTLRNRDGDGTYIALRFETDDEWRGLHMLLRDGAPVNHRARDTMVRLTGVHIVLTGTVILDNLPGTTVYGIVKELSNGGGSVT